MKEINDDALDMRTINGENLLSMQLYHKAICVIISCLIALPIYAQVTNDDEPFHKKMALHPKYRQGWHFPDTTITFKGNDFKCEAFAEFVEDAPTKISIRVIGQFTDTLKMDVPGIVVHYNGDNIILPKKEGVQKAKAKYLVWCFPPITGYNTDMYLHVKVEFNYQNVDECRIRYKMKTKKTKHPFFPISKEIYKNKDWDKCKAKKPQ